MEEEDGEYGNAANAVEGRYMLARDSRLVTGEDGAVEGCAGRGGRQLQGSTSACTAGILPAPPHNAQKTLAVRTKFSQVFSIDGIVA
jgi:hypothetical protein